MSSSVLHRKQRGLGAKRVCEMSHFGLRMRLFGLALGEELNYVWG